VEIREVATTFRLTRRPATTWLDHHARGREAGVGALGGECAALALPLAPGDRVTVRNRRAGDRLRPAGSLHRRRLKDLLIERRVPRPRRGRLPLLCIAGQVAWVPGIAIHEAFHPHPGGPWVWVAELVPGAAAGEGP
jgi:tRNA(Ile)-lysidine synthetase-like protein